MFRKIAAVAAIALTGTLGAGSQAALAGATPAHRPAAAERAWVARQVHGLLKHNPGAVQISPNAVRYKGAILGVGTPRSSRSASPNSISGLCPNNYVCLFWDKSFNIGFQGRQAGPWIKFYNCGVNYNLFNYKISTGQSWANEASSIDYPGSASSHEAKFNHNGNWWLYLYRDHYLRDLTLDGGPNPNGNSNDWITGLYAC